MGHRRRKRRFVSIAADVPDDFYEISPSRNVVIIGAGTFLNELISLIRTCPGLQIAGILDPEPGLKYQTINGISVLGWLGDFPDDTTSSVIGTPATPGAFAREAVYHILRKRGISFPILQAPSCRIPRETILPSATLLMQDCTIKQGASFGVNCLIGPRSIVGHNVELEDHQVLMPDARISRNEMDAPMKNQPRSLEATLASEHESVQEVILKLNRACMEIMLITDDDGILAGTITDGDIRRGILAGIDLHQPVSTIMNRSPITVALGTSHQEMFDIMRSFSIRHLPVVDTEGHPLRLEIMESVVDSIKGQEAIVMAGGLGTRLRPLTESTPKPLLSVAGRPILDRILGGLRESGLKDVVISVNYLADQIKDHVGDGHDHDLNVAYLSEKERLGTAGALSLLRPRPKKPFLVMNGDLLTNMDYSRLLKYQRLHGYTVVMCVRSEKVQIPYGVVEIDQGQVTGLKEKPIYEHFINAGIYALDPSCINLIPAGKYFDMTDLIDAVMLSGGSIGAFPIIEYWRDIGTPEALSAASNDHQLLVEKKRDQPLRKDHLFADQTERFVYEMAE